MAPWTRSAIAAIESVPRTPVRAPSSSCKAPAVSGPIVTRPPRTCSVCALRTSRCVTSTALVPVLARTTAVDVVVCTVRRTSDAWEAYTVVWSMATAADAANRGVCAPRCSTCNLVRHGAAIDQVSGYEQASATLHSVLSK